VNDEVPTVKDEAIRALGAIGGIESREVLAALFENQRSSDRVRVLAAEMLMKLDGDRYSAPLASALDAANTAHRTALYNGFIRVLGTARSPQLLDLSRRLLAGGVIEKSTALDLALNNDFRTLQPEIEALRQDRNASLAAKAVRLLDRWSH
jgi:HEAT repeat protein